MRAPGAPGTVTLVGAGPGDPGLLTLHALHALRSADVVVYDALVSDAIIGLAAPGAVLEFAGKRGGKPSPKQPDITARLIQLARAGKRVLRLKGGDPFVFGRGGEEGLAAAGVVGVLRKPFTLARLAAALDRAGVAAPVGGAA